MKKEKRKSKHGLLLLLPLVQLVPISHLAPPLLPLLVLFLAWTCGDLLGGGYVEGRGKKQQQLLKQKLWRFWRNHYYAMLAISHIAPASPPPPRTLPSEDSLEKSIDLEKSLLCYGQQVLSSALLSRNLSGEKITVTIGSETTSRPASPPPSPPRPPPVSSAPGMGKSRSSRRRQRIKKKKEAARAVELEKLDNAAAANLEKSSAQDRGMRSYSQGLEMYPNLCTRFPKQLLSLDCGFDQTPTLKKILAHYADDYVTSAQQIVSRSLRLGLDFVGFDPQIVFEFKPEICPRFPEKRETLSLDAGFAQTPVLKDLSTISFNRDWDLYLP